MNEKAGTEVHTQLTDRTAPMHNPLVTVVIPLYNGGPYILQTLDSVLSQTYSTFEILVVDDGSRDDGPEKVSWRMSNWPGRIQLLRHPDNGNHWIAASRNLAIRHAKGEYVAFIDQDDIWLPQKLEKQMAEFHRHPDAGLVYGMTSFIDQAGALETIGDNQSSGGKGVPYRPQRVFDQLIKENFIPTLTTVVRKRCLDHVGLFDEGSRLEYEDWLLFSKIAFFYDAVFVPEVLAQYRHHRTNYSRFLSDSGLLQSAEEHYTVTLFTYLRSCQDVDSAYVRTLLRRRIWFFLLRARSWSVGVHHLRVFADRLAAAFPAEKRVITLACTALALLPAPLGQRLRRLRRKFVGL